MEQTAELLWQWLIWSPNIILLILLAFTLRYALKQSQRHGRLIDRAFEHYDRVEEKLDRIAALLEKKNS